MKVFTAFLMALLLTACQSTKVNYLNTEELKTNYPRLVALNFYTAPGLQDHHQRLKDLLEPQLHQALQERGFTLLSAERLYEINRELRAQETNLYDPVTGQRDELRSAEIWIEALQQTKQELNIDAFVFYGIHITRAHFSNSLGNMYQARWDGAEEDALDQGVGAGKVLGSFFVQRTGTLPGASFFIQFDNEFDQAISYGAGGVELIAQFDNDFNLVQKPLETLFQNQAQLDFALQRALQQIDNLKGSL